MQHFRYIDTIRRSDRTLRPWEEHDALCFYESNLKYVYYNGNITRPHTKGESYKKLKLAQEIIDRESNGRR